MTCCALGKGRLIVSWWNPLDTIKKICGMRFKNKVIDRPTEGLDPLRLFKIWGTSRFFSPLSYCALFNLIFHDRWFAKEKQRKKKTCDFIPSTQMSVWHLCKHLSPTTALQTVAWAWGIYFAFFDEDSVGHWQTRLRTLRHKNVAPGTWLTAQD